MPRTGPSRRTLVLLAVAALAVTLLVAPLLPRSSGPDGALRPTGDDTGALALPAPGEITPEMQAEIDRVVAEGQAQPLLRGRPDAAASVRTQVRCAEFVGQRYCLHVGWTDDTEAQVQARVLAKATVSTATATESTGDAATALGPAGSSRLVAAARMDPAARARAERAELTAAARAVGKVWSIRHEIEGVPYPSRGKASSSPSSSASNSSSASASPSASASASPDGSQGPKTAADYPRRSKVLNPTQAYEQRRSYWCGPTTMQAIAWGWKGTPRAQKHWAKRLGTTGNGTDITAIVRVINQDTGWDRKNYAGPYITLDIGKYSYGKWYLLMMRHIHDYRAPVVLHPVLHKKYFPYLDDDASGHFQVGRGYDKRGKKPNAIGYFEPWNQQRFDPSEPFIARVQWRSAYKSFRANKAHPFHNIGV